MKDRFKFKAVLKNKTDDLSIPFLEYNVFDIISIGFKSDGIQTVTLLGYHKNGDYSVYEADAEDVELIQCTGLKDKNGVLIYEGDIMLVYGKIKEVVYWGKRQFQLGKKHSFCAKCKEIGYKRTCPTCYKYQSTTATTTIKLFEESEVIGNIYENKELLE